MNDRRIVALGAAGAAAVLLVAGLLIGALTPAEDARLSHLERRVDGLEAYVRAVQAVPDLAAIPSLPPLPSPAPTADPTAVPTPTTAPTSAPTTPPTAAPTMVSTAPPTTAPTPAPTAAPTVPPTLAPTPVPTAAPTAPPGGGTTVSLAVGQSLQTAVNVAATDTIVIGCGTHNVGTVRFPARTSAKPLTIRSATPACAIIRGTFSFGGGTTPITSSYITVDGVSFQGNSVADTGIVYFGYGVADHITLRNLDFRGNTSAFGAGSNQSHSIYVSQGTISDILIDGVTMVGPGNGTMSLLHCYHNAGTRTRITLRNFTASGGMYKAILCWQTMTNLLIELGSISGPMSGAPIDISNSPQGIIRNVTCSGTSIIGTGMTKTNVSC